MSVYCTCNHGDTQCANCAGRNAYEEDVLSICSNDTMDNLPGPGRGLDNLFQYLGGGLERIIGVGLRRLRLGFVTATQGGPSESIQEEDSDSDAYSLCSMATTDNNPGPGRGLDKIYQSLGARLERTAGVAMHKLGYGPTATEQRALNAVVVATSDGSQYGQDVLGRFTTMALSASKVAQSEKEFNKCCKLLAEYIRSPAPTTQLLALNALWKLRLTSPTQADSIYRKLGLSSQVGSIHDFLNEIRSRTSKSSPTRITALWRSEYVRAFDDELLDSLLASSRKALIAVNDTELHTVAKTLLQLKGNNGQWNADMIPYAAPSLQALSRFLLDQDLAVMAIAYVGRIDVVREIEDPADNNMMRALASILENIRTIFLFHARLVVAEGKALPDVFRRMKASFDMVDAYKTFLSHETRGMMSVVPAASIITVLPGAIDLEELELTTLNATHWISNEVLTEAYFEGYYGFLESRRSLINENTRPFWKKVEHDVAGQWLIEIFKGIFKDYLQCADCLNEMDLGREWASLFRYLEKVDMGNALEELLKSSESAHSYASVLMKKWAKSRMCAHKHGERRRRGMFT